MGHTNYCTFSGGLLPVVRYTLDFRCCSGLQGCSLLFYALREFIERSKCSCCQPSSKHALFVFEVGIHQVYCYDTRFLSNSRSRHLCSLARFPLRLCWMSSSLTLYYHYSSVGQVPTSAIGGRRSKLTFRQPPQGIAQLISLVSAANNSRCPDYERVSLTHYDKATSCKVRYVSQSCLNADYNNVSDLLT